MAKITITKVAAKPSPKAEAAPTVGKKTPAAKAAAAPPSPPVKAQKPITVTQRHLSATLAEKHGMASKDAEAILADVFGTVVAHLKAGERVRIAGLGIIEVKDRQARMGRNPATGASIQIAASRKIAFRPAKELKEAI